MIQRLKKLRKALKLSQKELAEVLGLKQSSYSMIETEKNPLADRYIKVLCATFNVNENWLRTGEGEMFLASPLERELIEIYRNLLPETREYLLLMGQELLKTQRSLLDREVPEGT